MLPLVFVIGDSISIQYGPHLERMLAGQFRFARKTGQEDALKGAGDPNGANGGDSAAVLGYLRAMVEGGEFHPDLLLLNCGLHDIKTDPKTGQKQVPLEQYRHNLRQILDVAGGSGIRMVWIRTTPAVDAVHNKPGMAFHRHAADVDAYNAAADQIMTEASVPLLDLYAFTRTLGGDEVFCDHAHFTESVQQQQAAFLAGYLAGLTQR